MQTIIQTAATFLRNHYQEDDLCADTVRRDCEHWERVAGDAARFPNANLEWIDQFTDAAVEWLATGGGA